MSGVLPELADDVVEFGERDLQGAALGSSEFVAFLEEFEVVFLVAAVLRAAVLLEQADLDVAFGEHERCGGAFRGVHPCGFAGELDREEAGYRDKDLFEVVAFGICCHDVFLSELEG